MSDLGLALRMIRKQPGMAALAIVALARKLIVALWRYLEAGLVPDGAVLKA